ncbi:hypothetical protein GCM10022222_07900 [Amycolatopsis ultiminotia]|uniref:SnoaL-like domain-containing protein n=1 Tax=Amycolatopsis ultiminotia TaxID=543629 RepID=A0ABP6V6W5_9PSEU
MTMALAQDIAEEYLAAYNQPDPARRAYAVAGLWTEDARQFGDTTVEGRAAIVSAIGALRKESFGPSGATLRLGPEICSRDEVLVIRWEVVAGGGEILETGATVAVTTPGGRIKDEYIFILSDSFEERAQDFAQRYVSAWNDLDAGRRDELVRGLWTPEGVHLGGFVGTGHAELIEGIDRSHNRLVAGSGLRFRARRHATRKGDTVFFIWDAVPPAPDATAVATAAQVLRLDGDLVCKDFTIMMSGTD